MQMKRNKKPLLIGALAVLLVALVVGGTIAWMTAQDQATNTFTVGTFDKPSKEPNPDNPGTPDDEDEKEDPSSTEPDGFLTETEWVKNKQFIPGDPVAKNPNVGVAAGSVDPYVFIYVKNNAVESEESVAQYGPYFTIEHQWKAVTDNNIEGDNGSQVVTPTPSKGAGAPEDDTYVDGLFMYVGDSPNSTPQTLSAAEATPGTNVYTGELFETITIPDGNGEHIVETPNVTVYAFIYGSKAGVEGDGEGSATAALNAAIAWAEGLKASA